MLYGRIPFGSIVQFADRYGVADDLDAFEQFAMLLGRLDADEIGRINEQANRKTP